MVRNMVEEMENEVRKNRYWRPEVKEYKRRQLENHEHIAQKVKNIKDNGRVAFYVNKERSIERHKYILRVFKRWSDDYVEGKTDQLPHIPTIANYCEVSCKLARKVLAPYYKQYLTYNTISKEEIDNYGLSDEEYEQIWMGEWIDE